jgi:hypothetical protein
MVAQPERVRHARIQQRAQVHLEHIGAAGFDEFTFHHPHPAGHGVKRQLLIRPHEVFIGSLLKLKVEVDAVGQRGVDPISLTPYGSNQRRPR